MSLEGERDDREPPAASGSWPRASWTHSEEFAQYRCAGQRAVRHEDSAAPSVPGELPPLPAAETRAARKPRTSKKWDGEILRGILGIWAILYVALSALVSLIERDRPDLVSSGNPFVVSVICASVVTVLCFGFAWLSEKACASAATKIR
jgi:hypothetical protein